MINPNDCHWSRNLRRLLPVTLLLLSSVSASAHPTGLDGGFFNGLGHPISGLDHIVAMVAVGMWAGFFNDKLRWVLPVIFPIVMTIGGALGLMGIQLPFVEAGIALSGIVLGLMVAMKARPRWEIAALMVAFFAVFHGHAHGTELPVAANAMTFSLGFVASTALLHLCGIAIGCLARWQWGVVAVRTGGAAISLAGCAFLFGLA